MGPVSALATTYTMITMHCWQSSFNLVLDKIIHWTRILQICYTTGRFGLRDGGSSHDSFLMVPGKIISRFPYTHPTRRPDRSHSVLELCRSAPGFEAADVTQGSQPSASRGSTGWRQDSLSFRALTCFCLKEADTPTTKVCWHTLRDQVP